MPRWYSSTQPGAKQGWIVNVARAMRESCEKRKCPKCGRKGACRIWWKGDYKIYSCRYCKKTTRKKLESA